MCAMVRGPGSPQRAITDLYDEERRTFLIQYPIWLVIALSLIGVVAFAVTGFFGYQDQFEPSFTREVFRESWLLFLWFCALMLVLQISIFRHASLRARLVATILVSLFAILLIGITYFNKSLPDFLRQLLQQGRLLRTLAREQATYIFVNFLILGIFWVDTVRRWVRRGRGLPPNPAVDIGVAPGEERDEEMPSLSELISGDLIAGAMLALLLALLFRADVVSQLIRPPGVTITTCTVSWFGTCAQGNALTDPPTITFIDLIQSLVYLPLGLLTLALTALLSGFGAVRAVDPRQLGEGHDVVTAQNSESSTVPIATDVTVTILNTLRSALDRRLRMLAGNLALSLRAVAWPALLFLATYGLAEVSTQVRDYLHSAKTLEAFLVHVLPALGWGLASIIGIVFSAALMLFRWRVVHNTLRFVGLIGFIVLITFWIFSLALFAINQFLLLTHALDQRTPFTPPSFATAVSFAALALVGSIVLLRRVRPPRAGPPSAEPAPLGARTGGGQNTSAQ